MTDLPIYLDYQATTPIDPLVRKAMLPYLDDLFGNPHSNDHSYGWKAANVIKDARASVSALINSDDDEIIFTSGATESCNLALRGVANQFPISQRNRIITLETEHPAVLDTVLDLRLIGFDVTVLPVNSDGILNLDNLERVLDEKVLIVSVMIANNEIGVIQPITEIASRCQEVGALFHTDATQATGRIPVDVEELNVDLLSFSSHKIYGPKGVGALFVRSGIQLKPIITGGSQERGLRGGTLSPALVAGFGAACEIALERQKEDMSKLNTLTTKLYSTLLNTFPGLYLFGHANNRLPGSLNIGFPGLPAEMVIRNICDNIAVSSGSACSSATNEPSRVLLALGLGDDVAATGVRISLGRFTTEQEIDKAIAELSRLVNFI